MKSENKQADGPSFQSRQETLSQRKQEGVSVVMRAITALITREAKKD